MVCILFGDADDDDVDNSNNRTSFSAMKCRVREENGRLFVLKRSLERVEKWFLCTCTTIATTECTMARCRRRQWLAALVSPCLVHTILMIVSGANKKWILPVALTRSTKIHFGTKAHIRTDTHIRRMTLCESVVSLQNFVSFFSFFFIQNTIPKNPNLYIVSASVSVNDRRPTNIVSSSNTNSVGGNGQAGQAMSCK